MTQRATVLPDKAIFIAKESEDTSITTDWCPVKFGSDDKFVVACDSNDADMIGFARYAQPLANRDVQVVLLGSNGVIPVKIALGGTATRGKYAVGIAGARTFKNSPTINGGSTLAFIRGQFIESGVAGDIVGLNIGSQGGFVLTV